MEGEAYRGEGVGAAFPGPGPLAERCGKFGNRDSISHDGMMYDGVEAGAILFLLLGALVGYGDMFLIIAFIS